MKKNYKKGFTLIELITSITLFIIVMTISLGAIVGIFDANRKSRSLKSAMNNLNLTMESMSKEMRYGHNYHCGSDTSVIPLTSPRNCDQGDSFISFLSSENQQITYHLVGTTTLKKIDSGSEIEVTGLETSVDELKFYVLGAIPGDSLQPKVVVKIKGHVSAGKSRADFGLQTLVSQRLIDL